jgi:amino acid adenylation domain-containing protein
MNAGTVIPRWTRPGHSASGWAELATTMPADLGQRLRGLAGQLGVDLPVVLAAVHAKVVAALASERTVVVGHDRRTAVVALTDGTWRDLVAAVATAPDGPDLTVEAVLQVGDAADEPPASAVLVTGHRVGPQWTIAVRYRRDAFEPEHIERVAGYHRAALQAMAADPDQRHDDAELLDPRERRHLLEDMNGERKPLPGPLFVELFEEQVARRADEIAASHADTDWSYAELNRRANQIARWLRAGGLRDEDVVAVVMERNLDWLAATLGVLKAGGVYLPVRPDFPAERVATQLRRSRCRFAVTEPGSERTLREAYQHLDEPGAALLVADAYLGSDPGNLGLTVRPDQLAYIYFTSGSTGAPKGAMCEHAGMLNHLYMKVEDLQLSTGDTVTQTASQCFDISLWQLLAPLLVGGRTMIIDVADQLDVTRFLDRVDNGGIEVIQIVPAYLDVMLSHLERDRRRLGDLRAVSVTGEALKRVLIARWFALYPDIVMVNAYGATEVSDDTMHAVLTGLPERELAIVPVGRTLRNVNTYIVDERLRLVPLGAPGEIVFSGVCVGRGYINDPQRSAHAFTTDPYRPGERLYRTGDFGRWVPEGTIEFLGRRDEQVKIRGYRIEIGEIESRLLRMPGVREAAVVITGESDQTKQLVAFYTGGAGIQPADLHDFLAAALPEYMLPSYFHRLEALPLNENGKVNKKELIGSAATLGRDAAAYVPPGTPTERRLATAWAEVLNILVGRIGRDDDFFRLGGTSLAAVRLVVKLDRQVSLRQLVAHPRLADLAASLDATTDAAAEPILQPLSTMDGARASLVCFPYAGGNAVNFQQLARELAGHGIATFAVELPGHDVARPDEQLSTVDAIAERVAAELPPGPLLLWGHCAGAAHAVALARRLERSGRPAHRLFIGAMLLEDPDALRDDSTQVTALSNRHITDRLHQDSAYIELDLLKAERAAQLGQAYRHDVCSTNEYLIAVQDRPQALARTPVEVILADDDPTTVDGAGRYDRWRVVADEVTFHALAGGGHYFIRNRAAEVAGRVGSALAVTAASAA